MRFPTPHTLRSVKGEDKIEVKSAAAAKIILIAASRLPGKRVFTLILSLDAMLE